MNFLQRISRALATNMNSLLGQRRAILSVPNDASYFSRKVFMEEIAKDIDHQIWQNHEDFGDLIEETKEEIKEGSWHKGRISDVDGNVIFDGPISEKLKNSLLKKTYSKVESNSEILPLFGGFAGAENKKSNLILINTGNKPVPTNKNDVLTFEFEEIKKTDEKNIKKIAVQKFLNQSENAVSKPDRENRFSIALVTEMQFDLNLEEKRLSIRNLEELRDRYVNKEAVAGNDEEKKKAAAYFNHEVNGMVKLILSKLSYVKDDLGKTANLYKINDWQEFDGSNPVIAECLERAEPKIYRASFEAEENKDRSTHLVNSPLRNEESLIYGGYITNRATYERNFAHSFLTNAILENAAQKSYGDDFNRFFKQLNYSPVVGSVSFPRDYSVYFDGQFHQTDQRVAKAISDGQLLPRKKKSSSSHLDKLDSHRADLRTADYEVVRDVPFDAKGGNMIFTQNSSGEKVLIATVSDSYFSDEGEFRGGYIINKDGQLKELSNSSFSRFWSGDKYPKFRQQIIDWGKEQADCEHVIVVDRNISSPDRAKFKSLYHLDVFCGALPGGNILIHPESVTKNSMKELGQVFGEDKIIKMSLQEKEEICANFVIFGKMVVMSSPNTPASFIKKINNLGFDVYVPPIYLSKDETLREGWPAGIRCLTSSTDGSEKIAEITDSKFQISDTNSAPAKAIILTQSSKLTKELAENLTR